MTKLERVGSEKIVHVNYMHAPKMFGTYRPWRRANKKMTTRPQDILFAREKGRFLTTQGLIRHKLQDMCQPPYMGAGQRVQGRSVCCEDSEVEAEAEDCRRDSASDSDSDVRMSSQSLSKEKTKPKQTKKDKKQKQNKTKKQKRRKQ